MRAIRSTIATLGILAGMLVAVSVAGPASAVPAKDARGGQVLTAPAAPPGALAKGDMAIAVVEPTTYPSVTTHPVAPGAIYTCGAGYFCALVWNPVTNLWKVFFFYYCQTQYVYNWLGGGAYLNNQNPPVQPTQIYGQYGELLAALVVENPRRQRDFDWNPVWSLKPC
ncbi:hypothetical protein Rhe02_20300 [Rhizocola hellebori]|uniref:Secreted protein n=1 Tax=Rhizocola hellebori TaxID=1392758 RepID=A0A8J3Q4S6_9ACTN|nr:hypothetical protein [Rhizocola hellebori]GIH03963.1 hypothetical protein Rhe02_20300 [Rhizocola hellebori]